MRPPTCQGQGGLRFWLGLPSEAGGDWEFLGEYFPFISHSIVEALLVDGTVVARWQDSMRYNPEPDSRYIGFRWPELRPPEHGWLMPTGGSLGAWAPR